MSASERARYATASPTGLDAPSATAMCARKPSSKDSTSISALSLSTTITISPASIRSPSFFVHWTILPSVIVELRAGMNTSFKAGFGMLEAAGAAAAGTADIAEGASEAECVEVSTAVVPSCLEPEPETMQSTPHSAIFAISSSFSAISATVEPTGAISPSPTRMDARKPDSKHSTSMSALSLSTTITISPASIRSPGALSH
mmetsp:Transcript_7452/g.19863  ORF Transcript_7452/g.19863 Transcript_7452/m.19863 type:complete len:202 (-) Transcript_7452:253-858(-)